MPQGPWHSYGRTRLPTGQGNLFDYGSLLNYFCYQVWFARVYQHSAVSDDLHRFSFLLSP